MKQIAFALIVLAFMASDASATMRCFWCSEGYRHAVRHHHRSKPKTKRHRRKEHHEDRDTVRKVIIKVEPDHVGAECKDQRISVVSTAHQSIAVAKDAAEMQWRARAQFMAGGLYMDPELSKDRKWLCSITDPRDTISGTLSEATAKITGKSGELYRCYFSARPCRANIQFDSRE